MQKDISLSDYHALIESLVFLPPLDKCCEAGEMQVIQVEPLDGRNTLEIERTCILQCSFCGNQYVSKWDYEFMKNV